MRILSAGWSDRLQDYRSHYHDAHEMLYILEGEIRVTVDGRQMEACAGDLLIFSRFEEHSVRVLSREYRRYTLLIHPEISGREENYLLSSVLVNRSEGFDHIIRCGGSGNRIGALMERIHREFTGKQPLYETVTSALLTQLHCQMYRMAPQLFATDDNRNTQMVRQLQFRFEQRYPERFALEDLAEEFHVSASHLAHTFKKITGYSPLGYVMHCRISAAKKHLAESEMSISRIVGECGFSDESNFSRTFRRKTGMTPSEFRRRNGLTAARKETDPV